MEKIEAYFKWKSKSVNITKLVLSALVLANTFLPVSAENFDKFQTILDAKNCQVVMNQKTRSCKTVLHAMCDQGRRAAIYFDNTGEIEYSRVMVDGVNQTTFQYKSGGPIFVRMEDHDDRVDRNLLEKGQTDTFSFKSINDSGQTIITMAGTVKKLPQTRVISNQDISYLFWDWIFTFETSYGSYSSKIQTTTEFHEKLDLWLGNYVETHSLSGKLRITDDHSVRLLIPGEEGFDEITTECSKGTADLSK